MVLKFSIKINYAVFPISSAKNFKCVKQLVVYGMPLEICSERQMFHGETFSCMLETFSCMVVHAKTAKISHPNAFHACM